MNLEHYQSYLINNYKIKNLSTIQLFAKYDLMIKFFKNISSKDTILKGELNLFHNFDLEINPSTSSIEVSYLGNSIPEFITTLKKPWALDINVYKYRYIKAQEITFKQSGKKFYRVFIESIKPFATRFYLDISVEELPDISWAMESGGQGMYYSLGREIAQRFLEMVQSIDEPISLNSLRFIKTHFKSSNEFTITNAMKQLIPLIPLSREMYSRFKERWKLLPHLNKKKYNKTILSLLSICDEINLQHS